jgi:RNA recognition motif-containing protein
MTIKLFVAGLSYAMTDDDLRSLFAEFGTVVSAQVITDRETRQSKGFGFVELSSESEGKAAIAGLNGKDMNGRPLTVNVARAREERPARSFQDNRNTMGNNYRRSRR